MATVKIFTAGPIATNAFVVSDESGEAALIDPAPGSLDAIAGYVEEKGLQITKILITHSHWDHIADCAAAKERFDASVAIHPEDVENLKNPGSDGLTHTWDVPIPGVEPDILLEDGQIIEVGSLKFAVFHTPGHCPGQVCFYLKSEGMLFPGDHFFQNAIGTLALPTAEPERMWPSLEKIGKLPPETKVYPGHGPETTVEAESWLLNARNISEESWFPKFDD